MKYKKIAIIFLAFLVAIPTPNAKAYVSDSLAYMGLGALFGFVIAPFIGFGLGYASYRLATRTHDNFVPELQKDTHRSIDSFDKVFTKKEVMLKEANKKVTNFQDNKKNRKNVKKVRKTIFSK